MRLSLILRILIAVAVVGGLIVAYRLSPARVDSARFIYFGVWVVALVLTISFSPHRFRAAARDGAIFLTLGAALVVGYSYKEELRPLFGRTLGTLAPGHGVETSPGVMRFSAGEGGQFFIDAAVNGVTVHFLADTGASGIALSQRDTGRVGLDPKDLKFTQQFFTANGATRGAPVTLDTISIGPFEEAHVSAWVNEGDLRDSLLGMSFLSTLGRIEIRGGTLTIER